MKKKSKRNLVKYRFYCEAPSHLTTYNVEWNESIEKECFQEEKFYPRPTCLGCKFLETKGYQ